MAKQKSIQQNFTALLEIHDDASRFYLNADITKIKATSKEAARKQAKTVLKQHGFILVNDEDLLLEVERVYETRYDCMAAPERVRQVA